MAHRTDHPSGELGSPLRRQQDWQKPPSLRYRRGRCVRSPHPRWRPARRTDPYPLRRPGDDTPRGLGPRQQSRLLRRRTRRGLRDTGEAICTTRTCFHGPPLDTEAGGAKLLKKARKVGAKLVVIDTLIRTVDGEENSADTIKNFYQHTGMLLKEDGIALLRIDHAGKDLSRGQRGTSAKRDDVDVVWLLKPATGSLPGKTMLTLVRETARVDWIQQDVDITRNEGPPLAHTIPTFPRTHIRRLHYRQLPPRRGRTMASQCHRQERPRSPQRLSTLAAKQVRLAHVVKWMKRYGDDPSKNRVSPRVIAR